VNIHFKKPADIPFELIGDLCARMSPDQWIEVYEQPLTKRATLRLNAQEPNQ
jgi:hypothetical protein